MSRIKLFVAAAVVSATALVGLAAPAGAALIGDPADGLLSLCITIRPNGPVCLNL